MTNRVHIDAPAGIIDIEGEKEFVEGLLAKLFPLIEEVGFGSHPQERTGGHDQGNHKEEDSGENLDDFGKSKAKRKKAANPPKGHSCKKQSSYRPCERRSKPQPHGRRVFSSRYEVGNGRVCAPIFSTAFK